jgi:hypothetical protein
LDGRISELLGGRFYINNCSHVRLFGFVDRNRLGSALFNRFQLFLLLHSQLLQEPFLLRIVFLLAVIIDKCKQGAVFAK